MSKIVVLIITYIAIIIYEIPKLKKHRLRTKLVYSVIMIIAIYQIMIFTLGLPWPFLNDAIDVLLRDPANQIVEFLKVPPT